MSIPWSRAHSRLIRLALLTLLGAACGGTTEPGPPPPPPPPPAPVVTSVAVTPTAPSLTEGDSLQATAVVKDQNGQIISGKTPAWQTSAPAIATVSATGRVKGVAPGSATISAAVDGKTVSTTVQVSAGARIEVDSSTTVQAKIGSTGGSLTLTTGTTKFLLTVPQAALDSPVTIVMRSVRILRQLPAAGQFIAAVKLEPTGTTFLKPLILKLIQPVTPVAGTVITGYLADDQGSVTALAPADKKGDTLSLAVPHFSVGGWGQFVPAQFPPAPPPPTQTATFSTFVTNFVVDEVLTEPIGDFFTLFQAWKTQIILPDLAGAQLPDQFFAASGEATLWYSYIKEADGRLFQGALEDLLIPDILAVQDAMAGVLPHGITQLNARCRNNGAGVFAVDAVRAFMLQDMAVLWQLDDVAHQLDVGTVVGQSCVSLLNTVATFPTQPTPGQAAQLDLRYGVHFGGQTPQPLLAN
ncbi:MAG: Ig-like domain-containing protein, partial [Gammaproteobacteria bacterium]